MALLGRSAYTVQESVNMDSFSDYNYEQIDMSGDTIDDPGATLTYVTSALPAKKLVIYDTNGSMDDDDVMQVFLNGETDSQKGIKVDGGRNLPFTISGILMTSVIIKLADSLTSTSDTLDILTFH
jgi:hypothetical protein|tara:strand:- start:575 stop:949 length:375 start_codon:yes stop_codon:yes gene_type:complete